MRDVADGVLPRGVQYKVGLQYGGNTPAQGCIALLLEAMYRKAPI